MSDKVNIFKSFNRTFWVANVIELFERWAWYGMYVLLALYLTSSTDTGALGFSHEQKGMLMGSVTALLYLLPIFTGALADKIGFKKVLIVSLIILSSGYLLLSYFTTYVGFFVSFIYLGIGASLFKPIIAATVAKTTSEKTSSIGFGIFYMIVNIGSFIGPIFSSKLREYGWENVFYLSCISIIVNLFLTILFFKEPDNQNRQKSSVLSIIKEALLNIYYVLKDIRFAIFLIIITGFWTMYNQLFYTLPVFIENWVDTSIIYNWLHGISPSLASAIGTKNGNIAPEMMTNIDAFYIVIFQVLVSTIVMRFLPLKSMFIGILLSTLGLCLSFIFSNGFYLIITILIFAIGEMSASPKIIEYIGRIAPSDKTALYIGTSYLPLAGGNFFAGIISGKTYSKIADKIEIIKLDLNNRNIEIPEISDTFTKNDMILYSADSLNMTVNELTNYLWTTYQPYNIWYIFATIGIITSFCLLLYNVFIIKK